MLLLLILDCALESRCGQRNRLKNSNEKGGKYGSVLLVLDKYRVTGTGDLLSTHRFSTIVAIENNYHSHHELFHIKHTN